MPYNLPSLDPAYARDQATTWMTTQLFSGLVELDSSLQIVPLLAKRWEILDNGLRYKFILRSDVFFHEHAIWQGPPPKLTAHDVVYSFTRICNPKTASPGLWIFQDKIQGFSAYYQGKENIISGFRADNDTTFIIELVKPFPPLLSLLAMPYAYIVPKAAVEKFGKDFRINPIGTGPFCFKYWEESRQLILLRNEHYFEVEQNQRLPYLSAIEVRFIPSRLTAFHEFCRGNFDFHNGLDPSFKDELLSSNGEIQPAFKNRFQITISPQLNTEYLAILQNDTSKNTELQNVLVRKAISYSIDREGIVRYLLNGIGTPAHAGFLPLGMPGFDSSTVVGYRYNPEKSKELLQEAGYPEGKGLPVFPIATNPNYLAMAEFIQRNLADIGIRTTINLLESATLREQLGKQQVPMWRASWIADYPDPENYLALFYSPNFAPKGPNTTHFKDPNLDSLYQQALNETSFEKRIKLYQQQEKIIIENCPAIFLYYDKILRLTQPNITGLSVNPINLLVLKKVRKQKPIKR